MDESIEKRLSHIESMLRDMQDFQVTMSKGITGMWDSQLKLDRLHSDLEFVKAFVANVDREWHRKINKQKNVFAVLSVGLSIIALGLTMATIELVDTIPWDSPGLIVAWLGVVFIILAGSLGIPIFLASIRKWWSSNPSSPDNSCDSTEKQTPWWTT